MSVPHEESGGEALVVFMNPEQAEAWRAETGSYPVAEGFDVVAVDVDDIKAVFDFWGIEHVALWGTEPHVMRFGSAEDFVAMLESVEPIWTE